MTAAGPPLLKTQDDFWHLRRLTLWRLCLSVDERLDVNSEAYELYRFGQLRKARLIAEKIAAARARAE